MWIGAGFVAFTVMAWMLPLKASLKGEDDGKA